MIPEGNLPLREGAGWEAAGGRRTKSDKGRTRSATPSRSLMCLLPHCRLRHPAASPFAIHPSVGVARLGAPRRSNPAAALSGTLPRNRIGGFLPLTTRTCT